MCFGFAAALFLFGSAVLWLGVQAVFLEPVRAFNQHCSVHLAQPFQAAWFVAMHTHMYALGSRRSVCYCYSLACAPAEH